MRLLARHLKVVPFRKLAGVFRAVRGFRVLRVLSAMSAGGGGSGGSGGSGKASVGGSSVGSTLGPAGCWITHKGLETWAKLAKDRNSPKPSPRHKSTAEDFNLAKEEHTVQPGATGSAADAYPSTPGAAATYRSPLESVSPGLPHQSRSYPGGQASRLARTPSVSSQTSLDSSLSRQSQRGLSPQIRTFAPDGRSTSSSTLHHFQFSGSSTPEVGPGSGTGSSPGSIGSVGSHSISRSPSPGACYRAASLDNRCSSPCGIASGGDLRTPSPSQHSLASIGDKSVSCTSPMLGGAARKAAGGIGRCLSPLLIPSGSRGAVTDAGAPPASPLGALQPDLYQRRDGPLFLGTPRSGPNLGRLHLRLKYDFDRSDLHVHLIEAHDLAGSDQGGFNDPYVKLSLEPQVDNRKRQTVIHRNDPNPFFDDHFKFPVSHDELQEKSLVLQVFDYDRFSRNDVIGEVRMAMREFDVTSSVEVWGEINKNKKPPEEVQEILVSLSYLPQAERLTVVLMKARNLFLRQEKENIDPFVKVYLLSEGKRVKKKKTCARKSSCNPVWNEAFNYSVPSANFPNTGIEVCVMDQGTDLIGKDPLLGCCVIGPHEEGVGKEHWFEMSSSPRKAIAKWHTLR